MSIETHSIADDQVRSAFQRWKNLEEEKARIADDLKELFGEQKALGHDTKAMRAAFRLKVKMDEADPADAEHEALVDTYLAALEAPRASRAYARENIRDFGTIKLMHERREAANRSDAGLDIVHKHEDIQASGGSSSAPASLTTREAEESVVPHSDKATVATQGEATAPTSDERETDLDEAAEGDRAAANAGGSDVDGNALRVPTSIRGEGTAYTALPDNPPERPKSALRPHCLHPGETCGGSGRDHCHPCLKARQEEVA